jgi:hypothetical protein
VELSLRCSKAACKGKLSLWQAHSEWGTTAYSLKAGKKTNVVVHLSKQAMALLKKAKAKGMLVSQNVTVAGGATAKCKLRLFA